MRQRADRIRHAISFEVIGLISVTPLAAWVFATPMQAIGVVAFVAATIAMLWNYTYNLIFDLVLHRIRGDVRKSVRDRIAHTILFEAGLLAAMVPFIVWYLQIGFVQALTMDLSFAGFYLIYTFVFNWAYDVIYPIEVQPRT